MWLSNLCTVAAGCCSYKGITESEQKTIKADGYSTKVNVGVCEFHVGKAVLDANASAGGWRSASCKTGFDTAKCSGFVAGQCTSSEEKTRRPASLSLPVWQLVWEDNFDSSSCVSDESGVLRPNPESWTPEYGYKRGKELQWYQPDNAECKNGALVITAKRERQSYEVVKGSACEVKNWDNTAPNQFLSNVTCQVCAPPNFQYTNPCDLLQKDDSGAPACDCSRSAEFTSSSFITRGKKEFSSGFFEVRAKIDTRPGAWPSLWAAGDFENTAWPKNGEIDIIDAFQRMVKSAVIHANQTGLPSGAIMHSAARMMDRDWESYWHTWQMEWDEKQMIFRLDTEELLRLDLEVADYSKTGWANPFTTGKKFFFIVNLAIGGLSGGSPELSAFPVTFQIDYIRVWQKNGETTKR